MKDDPYLDWTNLPNWLEIGMKVKVYGRNEKKYGYTSIYFWFDAPKETFIGTVEGSIDCVGYIAVRNPADTKLTIVLAKDVEQYETP